MTNSVKTDIIDNLVAIASFWITEDNPQSALSIINLLKKIELDSKQKKRVDDLYYDFKNILRKKNYDESKHKDIIIPEAYDTDERKLMWVSGITIMNMFSSGNFEMAYTSLIQMSINWPELYAFVVKSMDKQPFKMQVCEWLFEHFCVLKDIVGDEDIRLLGYKIEKIEKEDI